MQVGGYGEAVGLLLEEVGLVQALPHGARADRFGSSQALQARGRGVQQSPFPLSLAPSVDQVTARAEVAQHLPRSRRERGSRLLREGPLRALALDWQQVRPVFADHDVEVVFAGVDGEGDEV